MQPGGQMFSFAQLFLPFKKKADATIGSLCRREARLFLPFKKKVDATLGRFFGQVLLLFLPFKKKADATKIFVE